MAEQRAHRVPLLGDTLRRHPDPTRSRDPRVRDLIAALATLEPAPAPSAAFRAELRAQLVAIAPRIIAEGLTEPADAGGGHGAVEVEAAAPRRRIRLLRPLIATACALTAIVLLLGGAVWVSQQAQPGDALYGIKRASESTEYGLTSGTVAKGQLKLEFAARRIGEVGQLLPRASALAAGEGAVADGGINSTTAGLVSQTLGSADSDVVTAASMLTTYAVRNRTAGPLQTIAAWTPAQAAAMSRITQRIPAGALRQKAQQTAALLTRLHARVVALQADLGCGCLDLADADSLGPKPCARCAGPTSSPPVAKPAPTVSSSASTSSGRQSSSRSSASAATSTSGGGGSSSGSSSPHSTPVSSQPPVSGPKLPPVLPGNSTLPGLSRLPISSALSTAGSPVRSTIKSITSSVLKVLPTRRRSPPATPSLPISIGTPCVSASFGPIGVRVGTC